MSDPQDQSALDVRVNNANALIILIASTGRRFFYDQKNQVVAEMSVDNDGRVLLKDEWTGALIDTSQTTKWKGFSHGGTLRDLIILLSDYVKNGTLLNPAVLGYHRDDGSNIWGYESAEMELVIQNAKQFPMWTKP